MIETELPLLRGLVAQGGVKAFIVVVTNPLRNDDFCLFKGLEAVQPDALLFGSSEEPFYEAVPIGLATGLRACEMSSTGRKGIFNIYFEEVAV